MFFRGQTIGKYKILSALGSGGFGTVYLAEDTWIDKKVAIKVPHRQSVDFGELLREPRLLASLNHPNIVIGPDGREAGQRLLHRDGVRAGRDAGDHHRARRRARDCRGRSTTPARSATPSTTRTARASSTATCARPTCSWPITGLVKVADFGTSRFLELAAHGTTVIGSPPYMAPEQFQGHAVFASDIYSLGVTMYQMLTGTLPYHTPAPADLERLMRGELVSPPRTRNGAHPPAHQRHHHAGDGAGRHASATSGPATARGPARRARTGRRAARGPPIAAPRDAGRGARPGRRSPASSGRGPARRPSPGSAGTAASRCTPARTAVRSAAKRSEIEWDAPPTRGSYNEVRWRFTGTGKIWMNGSLVDWADAKIHVASHVIHYGSGVFEGARCYDTPKGSAASGSTRTSGGCIDSAKIYRMDTGLHAGRSSRQAVLDTIRANGFKACYIRPLVYRGYEALGVNPFPCPVDAAIMLWEWGTLPRRRGAREGRGRQGQLVDAHARRTRFPRWRRRSANYANSQLIKMEAIVDGYAEGIALDSDGLRERRQRREHLPRARRRPLHAAAGRLDPARHHARLGHHARARPGLRGARGDACRARCSTSPTRCSSPARPSRSRRSARSTRSTIGSGKRGPVTEAIQQRVLRHHQRRDARHARLADLRLPGGAGGPPARRGTATAKAR